jgi:hypothetical protein
MGGRGGGGGFEETEHLAIDQRAWETTKHIYEEDRLAFKNCSPIWMLRRLRHLETLTIVGIAGFWRDESELFGTVDLERSWLCDGQDSDFYESDAESETDEGNLERLEVEAGFDMPGGIEDNASIAASEEENSPFSSGISEQDDGSSFNTDPLSDLENSEDSEGEDEEFIVPATLPRFKSCRGLGSRPASRSYMPSPFFCHQLPFIRNGNCGLALIDFISIPSVGARWRCQMFFPREKVLEGLNRECLELTEDTTFQDFAPENLPESEHYIDWSAWNPPIFEAALLRRTAPSCYENDW